jgi:hypothetical protein
MLVWQSHKSLQEIPHTLDSNAQGRSSCIDEVEDAKRWLAGLKQQLFPDVVLV